LECVGPTTDQWRLVVVGVVAFNYKSRNLGFRSAVPWNFEGEGLVSGPELDARHEGVRDTGYTGGVDLVAAGKHQRRTPIDRD
jgi:hypothetical protein